MLQVINMRKKLYLLIISFLCVTLTLSTTVYAWFQISRTGLIEGIEIGISLDDTIELSLDGMTYHKTIDNDMLSKVIGKNPRLATVTTQDGTNFIKGPFETSSVASKNVDYISFDLYFRLTSDNPNISAHQRYIYLANSKQPTFAEALTTDGTFITSKGNMWRNPIAFHDGMEVIPAGSNRLYYAKNAVRIASISPNPELSFIYDTSEDRYRGFGKPFGAYDYYTKRLGVALDMPNAPENQIFKLTQFSPLQNDIALDKDSLLAELTLVSEDQGRYTYQGMTTINIWLEGWDPDAFDPIVNDSLIISLSIRSARFEATTETSNN